MTVAQEEIFGPVVTVIPFEDEKDAIRIANDVAVRADGDGLDGRPGARAPRWRGGSRPARSGSTCRTPPFPGIPFGGYKQSGFGRELGLETLELYLETKSVIVSTEPEAVQPVRALGPSAAASATAGPSLRRARRRRRASPPSCSACRCWRRRSARVRPLAVAGRCPVAASGSGRS